MRTDPYPDFPHTLLGPADPVVEEERLAENTAGIHENEADHEAAFMDLREAGQDAFLEAFPRLGDTGETDRLGVFRHVRHSPLAHG
ncbi:hypothetical protein FNX48_016775 [Streptomyces sp. IF17]|nr:hypothetical protein [Streptomyces alkaliphilus]